MNCPNCKNGVLEKVGYVDLRVNEIGEIIMKHYMNPREGVEALFVCSLDECSFVQTKAAPRTLSIAKRLMRTNSMQAI